MSSCEVENLDTLISSFLPANKKFVFASCRKLTSSGENYGSVLLALDITIKNEHNEEETLYAVAKKIASNELVQKMFNSQQTFPNEVGFYQTIIPALAQFQKEMLLEDLINSFPDFYTARVNRNPSNGKIDRNSVLLIKNIKIDGFDILDRMIGFNLQQTELILNKMSEFHAIMIALKTKRSEVFENKIRPFLEEYKIFVMSEDIREKMVNWTLDVVKDDEVCQEYFPQLQEVMRRGCILSETKNGKLQHENKFYTLVHSDLWTNNIMIKIINEEAVDVKFVDFQLYEYASLTTDVVFFLYSSVQLEVLRGNCDNLLGYYYASFIEYLKKLNCDISLYCYNDFMEDMKLMVKKYEFFHILSMLAPIYASSKDTKYVEQLEMEDFISCGTEVTQEHKEKACFIVRDFLRRKWLP